MLSQSLRLHSPDFGVSTLCFTTGQYFLEMDGEVRTDKRYADYVPRYPSLFKQSGQGLCFNETALLACIQSLSLKTEPVFKVERDSNVSLLYNEGLATFSLPTTGKVVEGDFLCRLLEACGLEQYVTDSLIEATELCHQPTGRLVLNATARQLGAPNFYSKIVGLCSRAPWVELVETVRLDNRSLTSLEDFTIKGGHIVIDDFNPTNDIVTDNIKLLLTSGLLDCLKAIKIDGKFLQRDDTLHIESVRTAVAVVNTLFKRFDATPPLLIFEWVNSAKEITEILKVVGKSCGFQGRDLHGVLEVGSKFNS
jgi:EAL domain-containing protein (putative c-di-GMP-specific phosphodiesterase class I)